MRLRLKEQPEVEVTFSGRNDVDDFLKENPDWEEAPKEPNAKPSIFDPLTEALARLEHEQWAHWAMTLMDSEPNLSAERRERWNRLVAQDYANLSEAEKDQDRAWAHKVLTIMRLHGR